MRCVEARDRQGGDLRLDCWPGAPGEAWLCFRIRRAGTAAVEPDEFAAREGRNGHDVEEAYWRQFLEEISGISREEQDADLEAAPGGYGLSSIASLWRAESQSLEEDAV